MLGREKNEGKGFIGFCREGDGFCKHYSQDSVRYTYLDAKSIMGILSCDYRRPLTLDIHAEDDEKAEVLSRLGKFLLA